MTGVDKLRFPYTVVPMGSYPQWTALYHLAPGRGSAGSVGLAARQVWLAMSLWKFSCDLSGHSLAGTVECALSPAIRTKVRCSPWICFEIMRLIAAIYIQGGCNEILTKKITFGCCLKAWTCPQ